MYSKHHSSRTHLRLLRLTAVAASLLLPTAISLAAPPDLITGGVPGDSISFNMGATGARGWVYHVRENSSESRQIQIKSVATGSPAAGIFAANDVILGANGTGANPVNFTTDARKALANAINDAEARNPSILKLIRWSAGVTSTVDITLQTMGAYSATAPYNCPKSALILQKGLQAIMAGETAGRYSFGLLTLLAANKPADPNNAARMTRAQTEARALVPSASVRTQMMSDQRDGTSMITWERGHTLVALAEYYLVTGDAQVLPGIEAYAVNIAKNTSLFGTVGHIFSEKFPDGSPNGPMGGVYGPVNSTGMTCFLGLLLARECGLANPEIEPAIVRASRFFASYSGRGSIPYGEHEPYPAHESNGKSGLAALCFALQGNRNTEGKFFAKMATAAPSEREQGHTGAFFNYLWSPLGAAVGGEQAAALHFSRIRWMLDLNRRWDGQIDYDCINSEGPNSGSAYNDFRMSTAALLVYALPLRQLHLTGRGHNPALLLSPADITDAATADNYVATSRTADQLISDTGNWSPKIRRAAAIQLKTTGVNTTQRSQLHDIANNPSLQARVRAGACDALGRLAHSSSASVLANLLTDSENYVRYAAAEGLRYLATADRTSQLTKILQAAASTGKPLLPFNEEDPLHFAHGRLAMLLFYSGNAYGPKGVIWGTGINGVDRNLLYPAIRAVAANPIGQARSTLAETYKNLTATDVNALADTLVDSVQVRAPSDKMFSSGVRDGGIFALEKYNIAEGVPLSKVYMLEDGRTDAYNSALGVLKNYAGTCTTVVPNPDIVGFCQSLLSGPHATAAQAVLTAIAADTNPVTATPFKSIQSVTANSPTLTLPSKWTILGVVSNDHAKGNSIYTWRKIHGAGSVSFTPNGTGAARNSTVLFDGTPGQYRFEVKMSDSRGFTEIYQTVAVTLRNSDGSLPPNSPPVANAQSPTVSQATPTPITLTASDPEGFPLLYSVTNQPTRGALTGTAPYLLYTPDFNYTGPDSFTFQVMDSEGQLSSATVSIAIEAASGIGLAIYEPFNFPAGGLNTKSGSSEVGFGLSWSASTSAQVVAGSLAYGMLPTVGGSIGNLNGGSNNYGGARTISASALAGNGLLNDGATLWFSLVMGYGTNYAVNPPVSANMTNSRLGFALANSNFSTGNNQYYIVNEGSQLGSGLGVTLGRFNSVNGKVVATQFRDTSFGTSGTAGNVFGNDPTTTIGANSQRLVVGKITWGATALDNDTIELFEPDQQLNLGAVTSTLTMNVKQSTYDAITWCRGDTVTMDEIRFGPNSHSVLLGNTAMTADLSPPVPNPVGFHAPPAPSGDSAITMVAATAYDPAEVEYHFTCTAGGGHDSGWQNATSYTDTDLTPGVSYSYTVRARDKSPARNTTPPSAAASAIIPAQVVVPNVVGMSRTTAQSIIVNAGLTIGTVTTDINSSVPLDDVIQQSPSGESTAALGSPVVLRISAENDSTPPSIGASDIVDDKGGAPVTAGTVVTYTLTFSEDMNETTVDATGFDNAGGSGITIGTITETSPGVFTAKVTPATPGTLRLRIIQGAVMLDAAGNPLDTTPAILDDTIIAVTNPISPYQAWSGGAFSGDDSNGDGVQNAVAWALGATDPSSNATSLLPTSDNTDPTYFIFTYNRRDAASEDPYTTIMVQYGSDLDGWRNAVAGPDIVITPTDNGASDSVQVKIRRTLASDGKLFARLKVAVAP